MFFDKWFKTEKWVHVKTLTLTGLTAGTTKNVKIFIQLYESDQGNRKIENTCSDRETLQSNVDRYVKTTDEYQLRLVRWLSGRLDPEIPRYSQLGEEDTANALRGKVDGL